MSLFTAVCGNVVLVASPSRDVDCPDPGEAEDVESTSALAKRSSRSWCSICCRSSTAWRSSSRRRRSNSWRRLACSSLGSTRRLLQLIVLLREDPLSEMVYPHWRSACI
ncbi:hypothetical protein DPMN_187815 [Dreissena polymorpha]|uniref:Uncharacterized protein n=1 Tax=Dreissena polymorpha TaxID=45954 RepID=A0A9D4DQY1_DREPO|nr:hypothetical protein DPMN_187815 [Dreissena polymorpha]